MVPPASRMFGMRPGSRRALSILVAAALAAVVGCSAPTTDKGLPVEALHDAIAASVGDPSTCVLLADRATGRVVYRYGEQFNCLRGAPACDRPGFVTATQALPLATTPGGRAVSCPSNPDGSRMVGWAQGKATSKTRDLVYSAVMEGDRALPGQEISARLDAAFRQAGL